MYKHKLNKTQIKIKIKGKKKKKRKSLKGYLKVKAPRFDFLLFLSVKFITIQ